MMLRVLWVLAVALAGVMSFASVTSASDEGRLPYDPQLYGLYSWASNYVKYADDMQRVGIKWVRCGGWRGEAADKAALEAARRGVHIQPALMLDKLSHEGVMPVDEAVELFGKQVRDQVLRYGPEGSLWKENPQVKPLPIRYWQIWNEPNIEFLNPGESGLLRTEFYARLLKAATEEIRKLDSGAHIIAFNTAGGVPKRGEGGLQPDGMFQRLKYIGWRRFIADVAKMVGPQCFDGVGTHPYTQPNAPDGLVEEGISMVREVYKEQGFEKPLWFTEVGFPLEYPRNQHVRDATQQAAFTVRLFAISGANGVTQVQIMYIEDIIYGPDSTRRSFGFFTEPGKWRPQATATQVMIRLLPDPRKNAKILLAEDKGVHAYQFNGWNGQPIIMAWYGGEGVKKHKLQLPQEGPTTLVDMLGNITGSSADAAGDAGEARGFSPVAGERAWEVTLSETPIYIVPNDAETIIKQLSKLGDGR